MATVMFEIEETVNLRNYKTIRQRITVECEEGEEAKQIAKAQKLMKGAVKKLCVSIDPKRFEGGTESVYVYKDGRKKSGSKTNKS